MKDKPPVFDLTQEDQELWKRYMGIEDAHNCSNGDFVTLLDSYDTPVQEETLPAKNKEDAPAETHASRAVPKSNSIIDGRIDKKLKQGKIAVERIYDLHGLNQHQAYAALEKFIYKSYQEKCRCVLIITGKGKSIQKQENWFEKPQGVLKEKLPQWLSTKNFAHIVLKTTKAHSKHGGDGAYYIYLRKNIDT